MEGASGNSCCPPGKRKRLDDSIAEGDFGSTIQHPVQGRYKKYFKYEKRGREKVGICLECFQINVHREVKMANGNTSGLRKHLEIYHPIIFKAEFAAVVQVKKEEKQSTLNFLL